MAKQVRERELQKLGKNLGIREIVTNDDNSLPSPEELEKYEKVFQGATKWMMETTTKEQLHRHMQESKKIKMMNAVVLSQVAKDLFPYIILIILIALSAFLLLKGKSIEGSVFGGAGLAVLIKCLFFNKK
jgi:uncharacterized membrane protein